MIEELLKTNPAQNAMGKRFLINFLIVDLFQITLYFLNLEMNLEKNLGFLSVLFARLARFQRQGAQRAFIYVTERRSISFLKGMKIGWCYRKNLSWIQLPMVLVRKQSGVL